MYIVHDYTCDTCNNLMLDAFVRRDNRYNIPCPHCGENMRILPSAPNIGWDSLAKGHNASPAAINHFERKRLQQKAKEEKSIELHGERGRAPGS